MHAYNRKIKILFIKLKTPCSTKQNFCDVPPLGLWSMRTTIKKLSPFSRVDICDAHMGDCIEDFIKKFRYDIIGISVQFSAQHFEYLRVVKIVSKTNAVIIAGGQHAFLVDKPEGVSEVIARNGEDYFYNLFNKKKKNFDSIPFPKFKISEIKKYWNSDKPRDFESKTKRWFQIETSRGCKRRCGFCMSRKYWGKRQEHSVKWCAKYFKYLHRKGIKEVFIEDDNITQNKERFIAIVNLLKKNNLYWSTPNGIPVIDIMDKEVFETIINSNCWKLFLPFETGVKRVSKIMHLGTKFINYKNALNVVSKLKNANIKTCGFFIIGYPGETIDEIKKTLKYANSLPLDGRHIHIATPYRGTDLYEICKKNNYLLYNDEEIFEKSLFNQCLIETPEFTAKQIEEIREKDRQEAIRKRSEK